MDVVTTALTRIDSLKFKNLSVGTYTFTSPDCEMFTFTLPPFPDTTLNVTISSLCTNLACIQATGGMTTLDWIYYENAFNVNVCYPTPDYYYLYYQNSFLSSNTTGLFCDLTLGGMYHIRLRRANVDIKIFDIFVPAYQQPNLTGLTGLVCNGVTSANVLLIVTGNGAPFTYNLLNPPTGYAPTQITTADTFATFPNLPIGSYQFMVYDGCGASSDFTANVTQLSFTASWQRYCDNTIQFFAPDYAGWQYTWTNSAGGVVGNTYNCSFGQRTRRRQGKGTG